MKFLEGSLHHVQVFIKEKTNKVDVTDWYGEVGNKRVTRFDNLDDGQDLARENARAYDMLNGMSLVVALGFAMFAVNEFLQSKSLTYNPEHPLVLPAAILTAISIGAGVLAGRKSTEQYHFHETMHEADVLKLDYHERTFRPR